MSSSRSVELVLSRVPISLLLVIIYAIVLVGLIVNSTQASDESGVLSVAAGAKPDGSSDCTATIQKSLDEAARIGGSMRLPPGRYLVKGSLHIPPGVTLKA